MIMLHKAIERALHQLEELNWPNYNIMDIHIIEVSNLGDCDSKGIDNLYTIKYKIDYRFTSTPTHSTTKSHHFRHSYLIPYIREHQLESIDIYE